MNVMGHWRSLRAIVVEVNAGAAVLSAGRFAFAAAQKRCKRGYRSGQTAALTARCRRFATVEKSRMGIPAASAHRTARIGLKGQKDREWM